MKSELQKVSIIYIGESKRSWKSRGGSAEQKPGTNGIVGFAVKQRAEGVFLESLHLFLDKNSVDEFRDLQSTFLWRTLQKAVKNSGLNLLDLFKLHFLEF